MYVNSLVLISKFVLNAFVKSAKPITNNVLTIIFNFLSVFFLCGGSFFYALGRFIANNVPCMQKLPDCLTRRRQRVFERDGDGRHQTGNLGRCFGSPACDVLCDALELFCFQGAIQYSRFLFLVMCFAQSLFVPIVMHIHFWSYSYLKYLNASAVECPSYLRSEDVICQFNINVFTYSTEALLRILITTIPGLNRGSETAAEPDRNRD